MCCLANSNADEPTVELTTFTAGTPAKASEVNGNFEAMKAYIQQLEGKVKKLENGGYNIPVYGDGDLIGHSLAHPTFEKPYPQIKNELGIFDIDSSQLVSHSSLSLRISDAVRKYARAYDNNTCVGTPYIVFDYTDYSSLFSANDTVSRDFLLTSLQPYIIKKGARITRDIDPLNFYSVDNDNQNCTFIPNSLGDTAVKLQPLPESIKLTFNAIKFGL
jgi:hypothetical protein